jgi:hypothetical protein
MGYKEVGVPTLSEVREAVSKGFRKCQVCNAYRPLMKEWGACFKCVGDHKLGRNQDGSLVIYP